MLQDKLKTDQGEMLHLSKRILQSSRGLFDFEAEMASRKVMANVLEFTRNYMDATGNFCPFTATLEGSDKREPPGEEMVLQGGVRGGHNGHKW